MPRHHTPKSCTGSIVQGDEAREWLSDCFDTNRDEDKCLFIGLEERAGSNGAVCVCSLCYPLPRYYNC